MKKVALLIDSLSSGGAEKMVANLSHSLVAKGYSVTTIIMQDNVEYTFSGALYNFGKIKNLHSRLSALKILKTYITAQNFNVILDHRVRNNWYKEFVLSKFIFHASKVVYCVHHYDLSLYFPKVNFPFFAKKTLVSNRKIIAVSQLAQKEIKAQLNLQSEVIYNYPEKKNVPVIPVNFSYVIAVGRLEKIKQFDVLIDCFKNSELIKNNYKLLIFGEGSQRKFLKDLIKNTNLENHIVLKGFDTEVMSYVNGAKALLMTSKGEGFPMVLIEAIQQKTPVISFDCKSGPSEIITDGINGILVSDQNKSEFTKALNILIDKESYAKLTNNLKAYNSPFTEDKIIQQWIDVIES